jgi:hypothetical protein
MGRGQTTSCQDRHETLLAEGTDQAIEGHGREMADDGAEFQAEAPMRGSQGITGQIRAHLTIAEDEMGQNREHRTTRGAREPPDGDPTQLDPDIMGVARQAPAPATGRLMPQLNAQGSDEREHQFDQGLAVVKQLEVGRFIVEIDGDGTVVPRPFGCFAHVSPPGQRVSSADET